jgi:ribosomal protein S20
MPKGLETGIMPNQLVPRSENYVHTNEKQEALTDLPKVISLVDKLAKKSVIHKNKASNLKSSLMKHVNKLQ